MRKWLIMVLVVMKQVFLPQKCHPSESSVALITHRIISSGKVVIYRISLVITGCQKRRLDESSQRRRTRCARYQLFYMHFMKWLIT